MRHGQSRRPRFCQMRGGGMVVASVGASVAHEMGGSSPAAGPTRWRTARCSSATGSRWCGSCRRPGRRADSGIRGRSSKRSRSAGPADGGRPGERPGIRWARTTSDSTPWMRSVRRGTCRGSCRRCPALPTCSRSSIATATGLPRPEGSARRRFAASSPRRSSIEGTALRDAARTN